MPVNGEHAHPERRTSDEETNCHRNPCVMFQEPCYHGDGAPSRLQRVVVPHLPPSPPAHYNRDSWVSAYRFTVWGAALTKPRHLCSSRSCVGAGIRSSLGGNPRISSSSIPVRSPPRQSGPAAM